MQISIDHNHVLAHLPVRKPNSHKGDYGRILLLCGSVGYTGAAALAAMGALRSGAGLVYVGVPESIYVIEAIKLTEAIVLPLPDHNGTLCERATDKIAELLPKMDAVLIGPGLGCNEGTLHVVEYVLTNFQKPVIVDADGINLLSQHKDVLRSRTGSTILTPHPGEFSRIYTGQCSGISAAEELSRELGIITVLKGHRTVITDGKDSYINTTGNPGMAVGGSGDVLAGIITALVGQGIPPLQAAACGVWLHGAAGDLCAEELGQYGMLPSDMVNALPRLLK